MQHRLRLPEEYQVLFVKLPERARWNSCSNPRTDRLKIKSARNIPFRSYFVPSSRRRRWRSEKIRLVEPAVPNWGSNRYIRVQWGADPDKE